MTTNEFKIIYPTKKETHTVTFPHFLENNNEFIYSIYTELKVCLSSNVSYEFYTFDSIHCKLQGRGHF